MPAVFIFEQLNYEDHLEIVNLFTGFILYINSKVYNTAPQYELTEMFRFAVPRENVFKNGSDPVRIFLKQCCRARK